MLMIELNNTENYIQLHKPPDGACLKRDRKKSIEVC
jgi:hypothetical protein